MTIKTINLVKDLGAITETFGYGSCPTKVERGKIVLADFGCGGRLLPSLPGWLMDGTVPSRLIWPVTERILPPHYWKAVLRGREWMAKTQPVTAA